MQSRFGLRPWIVVLALAAGAGAVSSQEEARPPAPSPPRLEVDAEAIDLGEVSRGEDVEATFRLRNTGGETLRILDVKPG